MVAVLALSAESLPNAAPIGLIVEGSGPFPGRGQFCCLDAIVLKTLVLRGLLETIPRNTPYSCSDCGNRMAVKGR
jgi:hypothetical protein